MENTVNIHIVKVWTDIDKLSTIRKFDIFDKIQQEFFQIVTISVLLYDCTTWTLMKQLEKRLDGNYTRMLCAVFNKSWRSPSWPLTIHLTNYPGKTNKTCWALLKKQEPTHNQHSPVDSYTWTHQNWPTSKDLYSSALCEHYMQSRWPTKIGTDNGREWRESVLSAQLADYVLYQRAGCRTTLCRLHTYFKKCCIAISRLWSYLTTTVVH